MTSLVILLCVAILAYLIIKAMEPTRPEAFAREYISRMQKRAGKEMIDAAKLCLSANNRWRERELLYAIGAHFQENGDIYLYDLMKIIDGLEEARISRISDNKPLGNNSRKGSVPKMDNPPPPPTFSQQQKPTPQVGFQASSNPEKPLRAAIWYQNIDIPQSHGIIQPLNITSGLVLCGHRHGHIMVQMKALTGVDSWEPEAVQGFLTTHNNFIDRKEAHKMFKALGGLPEYSDELYSEDLY